MTSYAVSCCICSPKVSCASATSVFWPTASVPPPCRFASKHWGLRQNSNSSEILPPLRSTTLGAVRNAVPRWRSSKHSRLLKFNFVLHRWPHETTLSNSNSLRAWARSASLCHAPNQSPLLSPSITLAGTLSFPANTFSPQTPVCPAQRHSLRTPQHRSFLPLNLHKAASPAITGGFLHVAVSKARIHYMPFALLAHSRFRYSPRTCQALG